MKFSTFRFASCVLLLCCSFTNASLIVDSLDFSTAGQGSTHDNDADGFEISPIAGGTAPNNWELTFGSLNSDSTTNEFITVGGVMRVQDWGGTGTVTGSWTATGDGTVDIVGKGLTIGSDVFNNVGNEGITWFYSINAGTPVATFLGEAELGGSAVGSGTDVGNSFSGVAINSGDVLDYGFSVNVDGAGDGVEISSVTVEFADVPEPTSAAMFGLAVFGLGLVRRRK
jgi:hypothetical protein